MFLSDKDDALYCMVAGVPPLVVTSLSDELDEAVGNATFDVVETGNKNILHSTKNPLFKVIKIWRFFNSRIYAPCATMFCYIFQKKAETKSMLRALQIYQPITFVTTVF